MKRSGVNYGTKCFIFCNTTEGYELEGPSNVTCLEDGSWSADISKMTCKGMLAFDRGEHIIRKFALMVNFHLSRFKVNAIIINQTFSLKPMVQI